MARRRHRRGRCPLRSMCQQVITVHTCGGCAQRRVRGIAPACLGRMAGRMAGRVARHKGRGRAPQAGGRGPGGAQRREGLAEARGSTTQGSGPGRSVVATGNVAKKAHLCAWCQHRGAARVTVGRGDGTEKSPRMHVAGHRAGCAFLVPAPCCRPCACCSPGCLVRCRRDAVCHTPVACGAVAAGGAPGPKEV